MSDGHADALELAQPDPAWLGRIPVVLRCESARRGRGLREVECLQLGELSRIGWILDNDCEQIVVAD